jgi:hypothetical protein
MGVRTPRSTHEITFMRKAQGKPLRLHGPRADRDFKLLAEQEHAPPHALQRRCNSSWRQAWQASDVTLILGKSTPDAMGVEGAHAISYLRMAQANSLRRRGRGFAARGASWRPRNRLRRLENPADDQNTVLSRMQGKSSTCSEKPSTGLTPRAL